MTRYFGWYSSVSRSRRGVIKREQAPAAPAEVPPPPVAARRRAWATVLRQVFEVDPLICEKCGSAMRIVAVITTSQQDVIDRILTHLGISTELPKATGPPRWLQILQAQEHEEMYRDWYPDEEGDRDWAA